jgi:hypothetical protein
MMADQLQPAPETASRATSLSRGAKLWSLVRLPTHQLRQFTVLTHRGLDMLLRNPGNLFALFLQPIVITLLLLALFKPGTFARGTLNPAPAVESLLVICLAMVFFGISFGLNEICQEWVIFFRERMVNLKILPYVMSKVAILLPFLLLIDVLVLVVLRATGRLPADGLDVYAALFFTLALTEAVGLAIGLLASALVPNPEIATRTLPAILLPQALFCGGFVGRPSMGVVGRWIGTITVLRWSFEGAGRNLNVNDLVPHVPSAAGNTLIRQYGDVFSRDPWQNWVILAAYGTAALIVACVVLSRKAIR